MEKIKSLKLKKLSIDKFKRFTEPVEFSFGDMTSISGHNSQGKSSIAEAIAYAITGVPFFGGEKSPDRLYPIDTKELRIALELEADGSDHVLMRERVKDVTTVTYDGVLIKQSDLTAMFGERDVFLSIFNPLYFIEQLGDKGRNLLERYLPAVPHEDIMKRLSKDSQELIAASKMKSPEAFLVKLSDEIKELNNSIIYVEGQKDLLSEQELERAQSLKAKRVELEKLTESLTAITIKRGEGLNFRAMQNEVDTLYAEIEKLMAGAGLSDTQELDTKILQLTQALEKRRSEQYVSKYTQSIAELAAKISERGKRYMQEKSVYEELRPCIQCPTCKRNISASDLPGVKSAYAASINAISAEGKELTAQLNELREMDTKAQEVFRQFQADDISKLEAELAQLKSEREKHISASSNAERISGYKSQIQSLELDIKYGNLTEIEFAQYEAQLAEYERISHEIEALEAPQKGISIDKAQSIEAIRKTLIEKQALETAVKFYISERVSLQFGSFDMLNHVSIQLYDFVKSTGEVRDVFKFTYDGRPYRYLSYSEKVKAGLEISSLLKELTGSDYPVFIDNGESVPVIDNIRQSGQIIFSQVVKNKPLTVMPLNTPAQKTAA